MPAIAQRARARRTRKPRPAAGMNYVALFKSPPIERVRQIKSGLKASVAKRIISDLDLPLASASKALNVPVSTINRKAKSQALLSQAESERFLGLAKLIGQVQAMVDESGEPEGFDARAWTSRWLREPLPALGGVRPVELMDTMEGQSLVAEALARVQSGAYA
jgi:putative toxin-antitoxin system antitoxin component (TIGR02293 family)